jgi:hypothetical protein
MPLSNGRYGLKATRRAAPRSATSLPDFPLGSGASADLADFAVTGPMHQKQSGCDH